MKEISVNDFENIRIGHSENAAAGTGCTVFICENGMPAGLDVRGGGPASRESQLLSPVAKIDRIHAVLISGGSAFGLDAAGGVQKYLEERGFGYDVGVTKVPLVCQACLFDLGVGDAFTRPDKEMAYAACVDSENHAYKDGCFGAGTGCTVGKLRGMTGAMKTGIGSFAVQIGNLKVGAIAAVNALGDVYDESGREIAGLLSDDGHTLLSTLQEMYAKTDTVENRFTGNTTLGVVLTNASFDKSRLTKIAAMAQDGYARAIKPVHTTADGDSIFALSLGNVAADMDVVGCLAADCMQKAIIKAVTKAESGYGFKSIHEI